MAKRVGLEYICFKSMHLPLESSADHIREVYGVEPTIIGPDELAQSGLKTAVMYDLIKRGAYDMQKKQFISQQQCQ